MYWKCEIELAIFPADTPGIHPSQSNPRSNPSLGQMTVWQGRPVLDPGLLQYCYPRHQLFIQQQKGPL
jgi:hypothetical protein